MQAVTIEFIAHRRHFGTMKPTVVVAAVAAATHKGLPITPSVTIFRGFAGDAGSPLPRAFWLSGAADVAVECEDFPPCVGCRYTRSREWRR